MDRPPEWNAEIDRLFDAALELPASDQRAYLDELSARDAQLGAAVRRLLAAASRPDPRLDPENWAGRSLWNEMTDPSLTEPAREGERIGPYRIIEELGRGGMSVVYLAERADGLFEQRVALKFVVVAHEVGVRRFERERRILAGLSHPNIARLLDGGTDGRGRPYIVIEYVAGVPLDAYCDAAGADLGRRLELVAVVAEAVEYAHRNLVVHRDIKPSNVLVTSDGEVKLLDFGIATLIEPGEPGDPGGSSAAAAPPTATWVRVLTPEYASPEQVRGERITTASDVYQLGVLLYELLSGQRPFTLAHATASEIERAICHEDPPPPSRAVTRAEQASPVSRDAAIGQRVPSDLDTIVLKALAKEPGRRYASVGELRDDLLRYQQGLPVRARRATVRYRASRFVRRHRIGVAAAAVTFTSLLAGLGVSSWQSVVASRARDRAERARVQAETVSEFLVEVFEVSDPERSRADELTARELLDRGARRVDEALDDDPRLAASLMGVMGRAYRNLGLYNDAEPLLETAVGLRRESAGGAPDAAALAGSLNQLGQLRFAQRRLDDAAGLFDEALAIQRRLHGPEHPDIAKTLGELSFLRHLQGDLDGAESFARETLAMRRRLLGDGHPDVALARTGLARVYLHRHDLDAAAEQLAEAVARQRDLGAAHHRELAESIRYLAQVRESQGSHDEARELHAEAHDILRRLLGPDHPRTVDAYYSLGALLYSQRRFEEATAIFQVVLETRRRTLGESHPLVANTLVNLSAALRNMGRLEEAESRLLEGLQNRRNTHGEDHHMVAQTLWHLGHLRRDQNRLADAEAAFRQAAETYRRVLPDAPATLGRILADLGTVLLELGRREAAERQLREAIPILERAYGAEHPHTTNARLQLEAALGASPAEQLEPGPPGT